MLCKVILRTVNDSEKSHEVLLNRGSIYMSCFMTMTMKWSMFHLFVLLYYGYCRPLGHPCEEQVAVHVSLDGLMIGELPFYYYNEGVRTLGGEVIDLNGQLGEIHSLLGLLPNGSSSSSGSSMSPFMNGQQGQS